MLELLSALYLCPVCFVLMLDAQLLDWLKHLLHHMEAVDGDGGIGKALLNNGMHAFREIHRNLQNFRTFVP